MRCSPRQRWNWTWQMSPKMEPTWNRLYCNSAVTVAILVQGTRWALAAKQAFCPFTSPMLQPMGLWPSWPPDSVLQHLIPSGASQAQVTCPVTFHFLSAAIFYSCHLAAWQQALHSMLVACLLASTVLLSSFLHAVQPSPALELDLADVT